MPVIVVGVILWQTVCGGQKAGTLGGPYCFIRFGLVSFLLASLMLIAMACPHFNLVTELSWFGVAQTQLQLYGFFAMTMFGAIYHLLPRVVGFEWPFPKLARLQLWLSMRGVLLFVAPLAIGGMVQGVKLQNGIAFMDAIRSMLPFLRASTTGLLLIVLGNLLFALNIFALTTVWKLSLLKPALATVKAAFEPSSASAPLQRDHEEVKV